MFLPTFKTPSHLEGGCSPSTLTASFCLNISKTIKIHSQRRLCSPLYNTMFLSVSCTLISYNRSALGRVDCMLSQINTAKFSVVLLEKQQENKTKPMKNNKEFINILVQSINSLWPFKSLCSPVMHFDTCRERLTWLHPWNVEHPYPSSYDPAHPSQLSATAVINDSKNNLHNHRISLFNPQPNWIHISHQISSSTWMDALRSTRFITMPVLLSTCEIEVLSA